MMSNVEGGATKEVRARHRVAALGEMSDKITWVEPVVPRVTPGTLSGGRAAAAAAYHHAVSALREKLPAQGPSSVPRQSGHDQS
ncbi:MAG TPA: hypothetical protein VNI02_05890 [Blastocatellia bacterium]|jgi:hypothetical protein|nr:hypothetical protein [Blastocatellia bacterium]